MKLIFCLPKILRNSHREIFGLDQLIKEGYEIVLLDLTLIHGGKSTCDDNFMLSLTKSFNNLAELDAFIENLDSNPVIFLSNDGYLTRAFESINRLRRKQDLILAFKTKTIPVQHEKLRGFKLFLNNIVHGSNASFSFLKYLYTLNRKYVIPDYFLCSTTYILPLKTLLTVKKNNIIIAHSDDVNKIIKDKETPEQVKRTGVFLDQVIPISLRDHLPKDYFDRYYKNLSRTLDSLKLHLQLDEILIAEHPESARFADRLDNKFRGFERIRNKTQKLIKNSTYVFAHFSTSIGFAVYYNKPIIILTDDILMKLNHTSLAMTSFVRMLNCPVVNMEEIDLSKLEDLKKINKKSYQEYVEKFMVGAIIEENSYVYSIHKISEDISKIKKI